MKLGYLAAAAACVMAVPASAATLVSTKPADEIQLGRNSAFRIDFVFDQPVTGSLYVGANGWRYSGRDLAGNPEYTDIIDVRPQALSNKLTASVTFKVPPTSWFEFFYYNTENLSPTARVQVFLESVSGVPEPSPWAMIILGFGVVGGAMRRRQSVKVSYAI